MPPKRYWLPILWVLCACICYSAVWVSPARFWPAAFVSMFGIPAILGSSIVLLLLSLLGRWKKVWPLAFAACMLLGLPFLRATFAFGGQKRETDNTIRVISFNLGKHYVTENRLEEKKFYQRRLTRWLKTEQADILLLQEVFNYAIVPEFRILDNLRKGGYQYRSWVHHTDHKDTVGSGMAILAKYPLFHKKVVYSKPGSINMVIRADCALPSGRIRLINVHLQSIRLSYQDLSLGNSYRDFLQNVRSVFKKMRKAYINRAKQVEALCQDIHDSPYPVFVGGDFNDTPYSYSYWQVRKSLNSAFETAGSGMGNTYNGRFRLGLRIDHHFSSNAIECLRLTEVDTLPYSDHYALEGFYKLPPKEN